jgi:hypothetical protein
VRLIRLSIAVGVPAAYFSYVFQVSDGVLLDSGLGNWVDPYFINYLLEHWHHSLWHLTSPASPPMDFSVRGTLGYSHGLILFAPFYLLVRLFVDAFQAYNLSLILVMEVGAVCLYFVLRRLRLGFAESVLLAAFFFTSENVINEKTAVWTQRASVFLIPPIVLLAIRSAAMPAGRRRAWLAGQSGLLAGLLFTQDFYTAQLALLVAALLLVGSWPFMAQPRTHRLRSSIRTAVAAMTAPIEPDRTRPGPSRGWLIAAALAAAWSLVVLLHPVPRTTIGGWRFSANDPVRPFEIALLFVGWFAARRWHFVRRLNRAWQEVDSDRRFSIVVRGWLAPFAMGAGAACGLFLWIYAAAYREHHGFPEQQLMESLTALDLSAWRGDVLAPLRVYDSLRSFTLLLTVGVLVWLPWLGVERSIRRYVLWMWVVAAIVLAIPLHYHGLSLWKVMFAPLPGLSIIRDPKRVIYLYELAVVLVLGWLVARLPPKSVPRIAVSVIVLTLIGAQWNRQVFPFERPRRDYYRWVEAPIGIEGTCQSFFIKGASAAYMSRSPHMWTLYGVDAMFISLNHSLPTLNGYSAWAPSEWRLANPQEHEYPEAVARWIQRYDLRNVCELDIERRTMKPYHVPAGSNLSRVNAAARGRPGAGAAPAGRSPAARVSR